jgi:hypothetical protein
MQDFVVDTVRLVWSGYWNVTGSDGLKMRLEWGRKGMLTKFKKRPLLAQEKRVEI